MDSLFFGLIAITIFMFGYHIGRVVAGAPGEAEMFQRLVQARVERKRVAATTESLDAEIEAEADRIVRTDA